jgi:hypothetical protein
MKAFSWIIAPAFIVAFQAASPRVALATYPWANGYIILSDGVQPDQTYQFDSNGHLSQGITFHVLASPSGLAQAGGSGFTVTVQDASHNTLNWGGGFWIAGGQVTDFAANPKPLVNSYNPLACGNSDSGDLDLVPYLTLASPPPATVHPAFAGSGQGEFYVTFDEGHGLVYSILAGISSIRSTDLDGDGDTDEADVVSMRNAIAAGSTDPMFDLNWDGIADRADLDIMVTELNSMRGSGRGYCNGSDYPTTYDPTTSYVWDTTAPSAPTNLCTTTDCSQYILNWTAGGNDGTTGTAYQYEIRRSPSAITDANFASDTLVAIIAPAASGTSQSYATGVAPSSGGQYFAIKAKDEFMNTASVVSTYGPPPPTLPPAPPSLGVSNGSEMQLVSFTDPYGAPASYEIRTSPAPITSANWGSATSVATINPTCAGNNYCIPVYSLSECTYYYYALRATYCGSVSSLATRSGKTRCTGGITFDCGSSAVQARVDDLPKSLEFSQPRPTPARDVAHFEFAVPAEMAGQLAELNIYDLLGRRVRQVLHERMSAGVQTVEWRLDTDTGGRAERGVYFAKLRIGSRVMTRTVIAQP